MRECSNIDVMAVKRWSPVGSTVTWHGKRYKVLKTYPNLVLTTGGLISWKDLAVEKWYAERGEKLPSWYPTDVMYGRNPGAHHSGRHFFKTPEELAKEDKHV